MAFTTWDDLISDLKDALADWVSGDFTTKSYTVAGRSKTFRDVREIEEALDMARRQKARESTGGRVSYGRHRRFP